MRIAVSMAALFVALEVLSCGDSESLQAGETVTAEQACTENASAFCSKLESCAPFVISATYGDAATCSAVAKTACADSFRAPNTGATPAAVHRCAEDLAMISCSDMLAHKPPASCQPKGGTLADGSPCGDDWQCMSGRCAIPDNATCGVCAALSGPGGSCPNNTNSECQIGLICANNRLCVVPGPTGMGCDVDHPCALPNVCVGATANAQGTCTPGGLDGAACTNEAGCDVAQGLWCNQTATRTCTKMTFADAGSRCGYVTNYEFAVCRGADGVCNFTPGMTTGTCPTLAMPGETCSRMAPCRAGSLCVNDVCTTRDPPSCR